MHETDRRPEHLGWIEAALRAGNPNLLRLGIFAQSHYGPRNRRAFIVVVGVDDDGTRRRKIRAEASDMLRDLGCAVEVEPGRDVYDLEPIRAASAHDLLRMLSDLRAARDRGG